MVKYQLNKPIKGTKCWRKRYITRNYRGRIIYQEFRNGDYHVDVTTLMPKLHAIGIHEGFRHISGKAHKSVKEAMKEATKYMKKHDKC